MTQIDTKGEYIHMIIKREYEWFGTLYNNDPDSKAIIEKGFALVNMSDERKRQLIAYNNKNTCAFLNIGSGLPGETYKYMIQEFEKLDKIKPYDNGLNFGDANKIEYETSRKGTAIQMRFVREINTDDEQSYRIVGFAALESNGGKVSLNDGWRMSDPFVIG